MNTMQTKHQHFNRVLSFIMALAMVLTMIPLMPLTASAATNYVVAGTSSLCGSNWNPGDSTNAMLAIGNDVYAKVYTNVPSGNHAFKVTNGSWSSAWPGNDYSLTVSKANSTVIIIFNSSSKGITVLQNPNYTIAGTISAAGWVPENGDKLTDTNHDGVYEYTYSNVSAGSYEFKVTIGSWTAAWPKDNQKLTVGQDGSTVTITFNPSTQTVTTKVVAPPPPTTEPPSEPEVTKPEEPETITVYFRNDWLWPEVYVHYWNAANEKTQTTTWPGDQMTYVETINELNIYSAEIPVWATKLIFNGLNHENSEDRQQTPDVTGFKDGSAYYIHWADGNQVSQFTYPPETVNNITIHYRNTGIWDSVYGYGWKAGTDTTVLGSWPGTKLTENPDHKNWYTVELTNLDALGGIGILFNHGSDNAKTDDIMLTAEGEYWYDSMNGGLLTAAPTSWADGSIPLYNYNVKLHFVNVRNWGTVKLYTWGAAGNTHGSFPGTQLFADESGWYTSEFTYLAPEGQGLSFLYSGDGQTVDLWLDPSAFTRNTDGSYTIEKWVGITTQTDGKYNADIEDNADTIVWPMQNDGQTVTIQYKNKNATSVSLAGTFNGWQGTAMTKQGDGVWTYTLNGLAPGIYQYKFIENNSPLEESLKDPLNNWYLGDNCAFLISDPTKDNNEITIRVFYRRSDNNYTGWNLFTWGTNWEGGAKEFQVIDGEHVATIKNVDGRSIQSISMKVRKSVDGNEWAAQEGEVVADLSNIVSGTVDLYINCTKETADGNNLSHEMNWSRQLNTDVVLTKKINSVELDYDHNLIVVKVSSPVSNTDVFSIYKDGEPVDIISSVDVSGSTYTLHLKKTLDLVTLHQYTVRFSEQVEYKDYDYTINTNTVYASQKFTDEFTYTGKDLGANWTKDSTKFVVWAPTAEAVSVKLYKSGTKGTDDQIESIPMDSGINGTWVATVNDDLNGVYYTYSVTVGGETVESVDPYARTTGVNGKRGMVIDLDSTDPAGWAQDKNPNPITSYTDAVIYELHVRDFSIDASSGISADNKGKYLAFTENGTTIPGTNISTGIDYLEDLGITHLHLLPVYDYGSVDETTCDTFNWGYDPVNYNAPEGSYSTNPYDGATRVSEFKQMVKSLHDHGISVIMDVVYNHVYDAGKFSVNMIVPNYFSRVNADGSYSNGSGCGNDTASEREMVRKYIVESVLYWHQEYHIDGFRFDLVGLLDATTINQIVEEVHACCPDVIFYGEGWTLGTAVEPGNTMATQANSSQTPDFAYFSDTIRNLLAGVNGSSKGFVSGEGGKEGDIAANFKANPGWSNDPQQVVQYASCHDNYTLVDKLIISTGKAKIDDDIIKMNNLAAAIYMTSQGIPFIHAGEEFLREKLETDGDRCENSYNALDSVNQLKWSNLNTYANNVAYYKGLIEFRNAHPALRMATSDQIQENIAYTKVSDNVVMFTIDASEIPHESAETIIVIFNATKFSKTVKLPAGEWNICINRTTAGTKTLGTENDSDVEVAGISAMVLVQNKDSSNLHTLTHVEATPATCTENGNTEYYICNLCVDSEHNPTYYSTAAGTMQIQNESWIIKAGSTLMEHQYGKAVVCNIVNGTDETNPQYDLVSTCASCGATVSETITLSKNVFEGMAMNLSETLDLKFNVFYNDTKAGGHEAEVTRINANTGAVTESTIEQAKWKYASEETDAIIVENIAAAQMTDMFHIVIRNKHKEIVGVFTGSIRDYAMQEIAKQEALGEDQNEKRITMFVDMLNYGAEAQNYFKYATNDLANAQLTDAQKAYATDKVTGVESESGGKGFYESSLQLGSKIQLNFAFYESVVTKNMRAEITYVNVYGKEVKETIDGSNFKPYYNKSLYLTVGIPVACGGDIVTCTIYDSDTVVTSAQSSVEGYLVKMENEHLLYPSMLKFIKSAYAYFDSLS